MNVLFAVSECVPFVKSGGLADVAGALPKELKKLGVDVRVILPKYHSISDEYRSKMIKIKEIEVMVGWRRQYCGIEKLELDGITYYFIDNEQYFKRDHLYGYYDDGERFAYYCRAILDAIPYLEFDLDVIHCHDWHTGMVNFLLNAQYRHLPMYKDIKTVFTIHNLQFQGIYPEEILSDLLNLDHSYFTIDQLEFEGCVSFMKAAIVASDKITTVSPTYRNEIQMPYYGEKLDALLRARSHALTGILNGIDHQIYNPEYDQFIKQSFGTQSIEKKCENKRSIQQHFALPENLDIPLIVIISRLTGQKGLDLVRHVFHEIVQNDVQFIVLGTGDKEFEEFFKQMEVEYPNKVRAHIGFNEELAHQLYAASDLFLMPSKFEPCGLGQLIAMRYGAIPIVRETGGLNDTVQPYNQYTRDGNGFSFQNYNAHELLHTVNTAIQLYFEDKNTWNLLVKSAMTKDYSWGQSAKKYIQLYSHSN